MNNKVPAKEEDNTQMLMAIGIGVLALCVCLVSMLCMANYKKKSHIVHESELQSQIRKHKSDNQELQEVNK